MDSRGSDVDIDLESGLESGGTTSDEDGIKYPGLNERNVDKLLGKSWTGLVGLERSIRGGESSGSHNKLLSSGDVLDDNVEMVNLAGKKMATDKRKKTSSKGSSKPPRPPRGPSLDSADIKWVREFSELAALKRQRVERMKSMRKAKADKTSPLNGNLFAMAVTVLFCFVIIFQAAFIANGFGIQVVQLKKLSASNTSGHDSGCKVAWNEYLDPDHRKVLIFEGMKSVQ